THSPSSVYRALSQPFVQLLPHDIASPADRDPRDEERCAFGATTPARKTRCRVFRLRDRKLLAFAHGEFIFAGVETHLENSPGPSRNCLCRNASSGGGAFHIFT